MASLCHPWFTTTNLSYRFPILKLPPPPCAVLLLVFAMVDHAFWGTIIYGNLHIDGDPKKKHWVFNALSDAGFIDSGGSSWVEVPHNLGHTHIYWALRKQPRPCKQPGIFRAKVRTMAYHLPGSSQKYHVRCIFVAQQSICLMKTIPSSNWSSKIFKNHQNIIDQLSLIHRSIVYRWIMEHRL